MDTNGKMHPEFIAVAEDSIARRPSNKKYEDVFITSLMQRDRVEFRSEDQRFWQQENAYNRRIGIAVAETQVVIAQFGDSIQKYVRYAPEEQRSTITAQAVGALCFARGANAARVWAFVAHLVRNARSEAFEMGMEDSLPDPLSFKRSDGRVETIPPGILDTREKKLLRERIKKNGSSEERDPGRHHERKRPRLT